MGIYLDHAATSFPKPEPVLEAIEHFCKEIGANSGRGAYRLALQSDEMVFRTRKLLGKLFNIEDISRIIFTSNVTEALNLSLKGLLDKGDHVVTSHMEHNAMWRPLKVLEKEKGIKISVVPCPGGMAFNPADLEEAITPETRLVALNHASNVTGTLMPAKEVGEICSRRGVPLLLDTAQTAGVYPVDVKKLNISLLSFTGHKGLLGPTGTGGLYIAPEIELTPLKEGGTGGDSLLEHQPFHLPDRYEAGTLNLSGIAGLQAAVSFLIEEGIEKIRKHELELTAFALEQLKKVPGLTIYGPQTAEERTAVLSFNLENIPPEDVSYVLDEVYGIMVRSGLHCSPQAHRCLGTVERGAVRVGFGYFNQREDLKKLGAALEEIVREAHEEGGN